MGSEVYSWRVSTGLKLDLEREAALRKTSVSAVLNLAVREGLKKSGMIVEEDAQQQALHGAAEDGLVELKPTGAPAPPPPPRLLGSFEPVLLGWRSRAALL